MRRLAYALTLAILILPVRAEAESLARSSPRPSHGPSLKLVGVGTISRTGGPVAKMLAKIARGHSPKPDALDDLIDEPSDSEDDDPDSPGFAIDPDDSTPQDSSGSDPVSTPSASRSASIGALTPWPRGSLFLTLCRLQF